jgi:hypothetical protein
MSCTNPHSKLKDRLRELVHMCLVNKNGQRRQKYPVLGRDRPYYVKKKRKKKKKKKKKKKH